MPFLRFPGLCGLYLEQTAQMQLRRRLGAESYTLGRNSGLTPGFVRGAPGNRSPYRDRLLDERDSSIMYGATCEPKHQVLRLFLFT